jgi:hypothetical protein
MEQASFSKNHRSFLGRPPPRTGVYEIAGIPYFGDAAMTVFRDMQLSNF